MIGGRCPACGVAAVNIYRASATHYFCICTHCASEDHEPIPRFPFSGPAKKGRPWVHQWFVRALRAASDESSASIGEIFHAYLPGAGKTVMLTHFREHVVELARKAAEGGEECRDPLAWAALELLTEPAEGAAREPALGCPAEGKRTQAVMADPTGGAQGPQGRLQRGFRLLVPLLGPAFFFVLGMCAHAAIKPEIRP